MYSRVKSAYLRFNEDIPMLGYLATVDFSILHMYTDLLLNESTEMKAKIGEEEDTIRKQVEGKEEDTTAQSELRTDALKFATS